jgi:hypothetical protein
LTLFLTILPKRFFSMDFGDILQIFDDFDDCLTPIALSSWQGSGLSLLSRERAIVNLLGCGWGIVNDDFQSSKLLLTGELLDV